MTRTEAGRIVEHAGCHDGLCMDVGKSRLPIVRKALIGFWHR